MPQAAGIYARISLDADGRQLGVQRQEKDCRALCERKEWPVAHVYVDNDLGAWSGKPRPAYRRMLEAIKSGEVDAVVVWHLDRLTRRPVELEEFFETCDAAGVRDLASVTGDIDLSTDDGRFMARILGAVARKESDDKSRRTRRKHLELAEAGKPVGGTRPFGFDADKVKVREDEATLIRDAARRVLAGESLRGVCSEWNRDGVETPRGGRWTQTGIRRILTNPRLVGKRSLHGVVVADAVWEPVLDRGTFDALQAVLCDPDRRVNAGFGPRRYVLTGLAFCGRCGTRLIARARSERRRCYVCTSNPDKGGCGGIRVVAEPLEAWVAEQVWYRLDGPLIAPREDPTDRLVSDLADVEAAMGQAGRDFYAERTLSKEAFAGAQKALQARQAALRAEIARHRRDANRAALEGQGANLAGRWESMSVPQQKAVLDAVVARVVVGPAKPGLGRFDPARVTVEWS